MPPTDILGSYQNGTANPENGPNPEVKLDLKQRCLTQFRAIVRRLFLRLRFIFSGPVGEAQMLVYILSGKKK